MYLVILNPFANDTAIKREHIFIHRQKWLSCDIGVWKRKQRNIPWIKRAVISFSYFTQLFERTWAYVLVLFFFCCCVHVPYIKISDAVEGLSGWLAKLSHMLTKCREKHVCTMLRLGTRIAPRFWKVQSVDYSCTETTNCTLLSAFGVVDTQQTLYHMTFNHHHVSFIPKDMATTCLNI